MCHLEQPAGIRHCPVPARHGWRDDGAGWAARDHAGSTEARLCRRVNYLTIPALMGPVIGPALGGAITLFFHWRWIFIINLPIGLLGLFLVHRFIPNLREAEVPPFDWRGFALSGGGLSALMLGLSALGWPSLPMWATAASIVGGATCCTPMSCTRGGPSIRRSTSGCSAVRHSSMAWLREASSASAWRDAVPAPLLLQLGFGLNPLQSGLLTCATAIGAMFMKTLTVMILKRWGFRTVLTINAFLAGISVVICAFFNSTTPHVVIVLVLLVSGCLRSLQFTGLQALSFAETTREDISQATSIASMTQRLAQSLGIAIGAYALELSSLAQGHSSIVAADFPPAFIAIGVLAALSALFHRRLARSAGTEVSGHAQE